MDGLPCAWHSEGQGFESPRVHQFHSNSETRRTRDLGRVQWLHTARFAAYPRDAGAEPWFFYGDKAAAKDLWHEENRLRPRNLEDGKLG